eukprot:Gb_10635 [translate_table: standard]
MNCLMRSPLLVPCPFSPQYAHANAKFKSLGPQSFHLKSRNLCQSRASQEDDNFSTSKVVRIRHCDLLERSADLSEELESGFGPSGLGIIAICDVPRFSVLRKSLLELSHRLAALPEEAKNDLEDPDSRYSFGWSHGKEKLVSGRPDKLKGSFYANPIVDIPTTDEALIRRYSSYCRPNLWPRNVLPELEPAFKDLGRLIFDVGLLLAYHCDKYVSKRNPNQEALNLELMLSRSLCHKGRLLHYFPAAKSDCAQNIDGASSWCGWHTDHGSLTGLTCAMYMKDDSEISCPDNTAGLYIKTRTGAIVKAVYGENDLAYQVGEATEILSKGLFHATPHCVKTAKGDKACRVERNTFALFMQPHWDEPLNFLDSIASFDKELMKSNGSMTFGDYSEQLLNKYYGPRS